MINKELIRLMNCFPRSFINEHHEIIIDEKSNTYFKIDVETEIELKYKVIEWLSRPAAHGSPFSNEKKNREYRSFILSGINRFLDADFEEDQMKIIYIELGNSVNRKLTEQFVSSNYDFNYIFQGVGHE